MSRMFFLVEIVLQYEFCKITVFVLGSRVDELTLQFTFVVVHKAEFREMLSPCDKKHEVSHWRGTLSRHHSFVKRGFITKFEL